MSPDDLSAARAQTAAAYRRLADAAIEAAMAHDDPTTQPFVLGAAHRGVLARTEAVKHSQKLLQAVRTGNRTARRQAKV